MARAKGGSPMKLEYKHDGKQFTFSIDGVVVERSSNVHQLVQKVKKYRLSYDAQESSRSKYQI